MANTVTSKIKRIYTHQHGCYIRLENPDHTPKDGYFFLKADNANYQSLYSLALVAAVNRYDLTIRTDAETDPNANDYPNIVYLYVDW